MKAFALAYPEAVEEYPWGETAMKVRKTTFMFMSSGASDGEARCSLTVKLPTSSEMALTLPFAEPAGYNLARSGWVTVKFAPDDAPPEDLLMEWIDQSYRAIAPKKLATSAPAIVR
ncbi:MAG: MmcQ/YjbR family DNA-binding protein [Pseudomonadota bacterium]